MTRWTTEQGLPQNTVNDILETRDGYLWLATFDGAARFDGVRFTVFNRRTADGFPSNRVLNLHEDRGGALWMATEGGLVRYQGGAITALTTADGLPRDQVVGLGEDERGRLWVSTHNASTGNLVHIKGGHVLRERLVRPDVLGGDTPALFYAERPGVMWLGMSRSLIRYDRGRLRVYAQPDGLPDARVIFLRRRGNGTLWAGAKDGRWMRLENDRFVTAATLGGGEASAYAVQEAAGRLWVGGRTGLCAYRLDSVEREHCIETEHPVRTLFADRDGALWAGLDGGGLMRVQPALFRVFGTEAGLDYPIIFSVTEAPDGAIWAGTNCAGLYRLAGGTFTRHAGGALEPNSCISSVHVDRANTVWVGTGALLARAPGEPFGRRGPEALRNVTALYEDPADGTLWVGTGGGVYHLGPRTQAYYSVADGLVNDQVRGILRDRRGRYWFATAGGLSRLEDGRFTSYTTATGFPSHDLRTLYEDAEGVLWIGTYGDGLIRFEDGRAVQISTRHGLFDDVVSAILEDDRGRLWMSGNKGVFWAERATLTGGPGVVSVGYGREAGLRNPETNGGFQPAAWEARDGRMWFPTLDGVAVVDPGDVRRDPRPPPVHVERLERPDGTALVGPDVQLASDQRRFDVHYTGIDLGAPEAVRFRYRLLGLHDDWVEAGVRRVASYSAVPPGRYRFQVMAASRAGVWSATPAELAVVVAPFFYETRGFMLLLGLLLAGAVFGGYRLRERRLLRRAEALERVVETRTAEYVRAKQEAEAAQATVGRQAERLAELSASKSRFMADLSHELRTPMTLSLGPLEDLRRGRFGALPEAAAPHVDLALRTMRRQLRLIEELLDGARLEAGTLALDLRPLDLAALLRSLHAAFGPLAERRRIAFTFEAPDGPVPVRGDADQLEKVFANLLSNALSYTPEGGGVRLAVRAGDGEVTVVVEDSGPGIAADVQGRIFDRFFRGDAAPARTGTGIGLALAKELTERHGGRIGVESAPGEGARFVVTLPLGPGPEAEPSAPLASEAEPSAPLASEAGAADTTPGGADPAPPDAEGPPDESPDEPPADEDRTTVLLIDDDDELRRYLRGHLEDRYRVAEATDGRAGLAAARGLLPDLIVVDVMMPEMDGREMCARLRQLPDLAAVPIIMLTGLSEPEDRVAGLRSGADDYVVKPFHPEELRARVDNLIASRHALQRQHRVPRAAPPETAGSPGASGPLDAIRPVIEAHLHDPEFDLDQLARAAGLSRSSLYRRFRAAGGASPNEEILRMRLERAAHLLATGQGHVGEVAYAVGFKSVAHFSRRFRAHFGVIPSQYAP